MLKYITAGESHGPELTAILEGMPSGVKVSIDEINSQLVRRQGGHGRGGRMKIERDSVQISSGIRFGKTLASPITMTVENKDWKNWTGVMSVDGKGKSKGKEVTRPRPGHADLTGAMKYDFEDVRNVLERSSARETAARVAVGSVARELLKILGINIYSWVTQIGDKSISSSSSLTNDDFDLIEKYFKAAELSPVRSPIKKCEKDMIEFIDNAKKRGDSVGGVFQVVATGVPPGLGSYVHWERKLDSRIAAGIMSIQAIKGVEMGIGFDAASNTGSKVHDEIFYNKKNKKNGAIFWPQLPRFSRSTNNAGGIEGGMSNGEPIVLSAVMKPIPTLHKPLKSVDIGSKKQFEAGIERTDVCAVPAASIVGESVLSFELARAVIEKFGGDSLTELKRNYKGYLRQIKNF